MQYSDVCSSDVVHTDVCMRMFTSSGVRTTAGWEAGAERLSPAGNLEDVAERGWKAATEVLGPTAGLEAAAEYVMGSAAEEVTTLQEGSESSASAGLGIGFGASATSDTAGATSDAAGATSDATSATSEASSSAFKQSASAAGLAAAGLASGPELARLVASTAAASLTLSSSCGMKRVHNSVSLQGGSLACFPREAAAGQG